jgi:hypothetical protein
VAREVAGSIPVHHPIGEGTFPSPLAWRSHAIQHRRLCLSRAFLCFLSVCRRGFGSSFLARVSDLRLRSSTLLVKRPVCPTEPGGFDSHDERSSPLLRKWSARPVEARKEPVRFRREALRILQSGAPSGRITALQAEMSGFNSRRLHCPVEQTEAHRKTWNRPAKAAPMTCYLERGCGVRRGLRMHRSVGSRGLRMGSAFSQEVASHGSMRVRSPPGQLRVSVPVVKRKSCVATNDALGVRLPPGTHRSCVETEIMRASEARVASSTLARSSAGNAIRGGWAHNPRDNHRAQIPGPLPTLCTPGVGELHELGLECSTHSAATTPGSVSGEALCPTNRSRRVRSPGPVLLFTAVVAEWQTRQVEDLEGSLPCEFDSRRLHSLLARMAKR